MNERERFIAALRFEKPDRLPLMTLGPRESTLARWRQEGLPERQEWLRALCAELRIPYDFPHKPRISLDVDFCMIPRYEEKILDRRNGYYLVQDWMGNISRVADDNAGSVFPETKNATAIRWHKFPVETRNDFEVMKRRYRPDQAGRFPPDFAERCRSLRERDYPLTVRINGPFWQMREWCGVEALCMLFMDDPAFVDAMIAFWRAFGEAMLERILASVVPDRLLISDDMAFKGAAMISPHMIHRHLRPCWGAWVGMARAAGVPVIDMDSDGRVSHLIPAWIDAGVTCCNPIEVAAGNDIVALRQSYGTRIAFTGGIDSRALTWGGDALDREFERVAPVAREGGYIPGCDQGIPKTVSWANMLHFGRRWLELAGWS